MCPETLNLSGKTFVQLPRSTTDPLQTRFESQSYDSTKLYFFAVKHWEVVLRSERMVSDVIQRARRQAHWSFKAKKCSPSSIYPTGKITKRLLRWQVAIILCADWFPPLFLNTLKNIPCCFCQWILRFFCRESKEEHKRLFICTQETLRTVFVVALRLQLSEWDNSHNTVESNGSHLHRLIGFSWLEKSFHNEAGFGVIVSLTFTAGRKLEQPGPLISRKRSYCPTSKCQHLQAP